MFRFLLSSRWIGFALFVIALAGVCARLGVWQYDKLDDRQAQNETVTRHFAVDPVPLESALAPGETVTDDTEWTRVTATGRYDVENQLTVKFTTRDGAPGVDVVVPLVLADGSAVLVDRGWMETANTMDRPDVPQPPGGDVTIMGWLRQDSGATGQPVQPVDGQVRAISSEALGEVVPYPLSNGYLNLQSESPQPAVALDPEPAPDLGSGPHFFYALQWWFFALLAIVGYFWFARAEAVERRNPTRVDGFATHPEADRETQSASG